MPAVEVAILTLPMIDLLLLVMPKLRRSNPTRPFWVGFQVVGWVGALTSSLLAWCPADTCYWPLNPVERMIPSPRSDAGLAILISVAVVLYTTPQLLVALLAGRLSSKYRIIIERR